MGTRGAISIVIEKKEKTCYNHCDSYPDGLGSGVIAELKKIDATENGWEQFKKNAKAVQMVDESKKPSKELQDKYNEHFNNNVSTGSSEEWYALLRDLQGEAYLPAIMSGEVEHMVDAKNFPQDSLFCEYAYVIDLDKMVLEFYKGFQTAPQKGNRFGTKMRDRGEYYPVAKVGQIALKGISKDEKADEVMMDIYKKAEPDEE